MFIYSPFQIVSYSHIDRTGIIRHYIYKVFIFHYTYLYSFPLARALILCYNNFRMAKSKKEDVVVEKDEKSLKDLNTFIENVNKKDTLNGKRVNFGFTKRKR